jgi:hypothetical protein
MDSIATAVTICFTLLILVVSGYCFYDRKLHHDLGSSDEKKAEQAREHIREMAEKGYVQVPVLMSWIQEADDKSTDEGTKENVRDARHWQLAWVHKDSAADILAATDCVVHGDAELLEEALRST